MLEEIRKTYPGAKHLDEVTYGNITYLRFIYLNDIYMATKGRMSEYITIYKLEGSVECG